MLLPDHFHAMWTLPAGDSAYSRRLGWLKKTFTQRWLAAGGHELAVSEGKRRDGRRGVWQPKFWEHTLRDQDDFNEHLNYIHYNPVKHGLVQCPHQWPWSSFQKWVNRGAYERNWQCTCNIDHPTRPPSIGSRWPTWSRSGCADEGMSRHSRTYTIGVGRWLNQTERVTPRQTDPNSSPYPTPRRSH